MKQAYLPRRAPIHGEQTVRAELRRRTSERGSARIIADSAGIALEDVYRARVGTRRILPSLAEQLGFTLAWVRAEELALADKIEAELTGSMLKEEE